MNNMNQVIIEGNVVRKGDLKSTATGKKYCWIPVAVNRYYKDAQGNDASEVDYLDVQAWGVLGERACEYGMKGRGLRVVGRMKQDRWTGKDGKPVSRVFILAEHIEYKPLKKTANAENEEIEKENLKASMSQTAAEISESGEVAF